MASGNVIGRHCGLVVPPEIKHKGTSRFSNFIPKCIPKSNENQCAHRNLYTHVHDNIIHNSQIVEKPKFMSTDECINKWTCIHMLYHG